MADKFTSRELSIIALSAGLIWAGQSVWKAHIAENAKVQITKVESDEKKAELEILAILSEQETRRLEILSETFEQVPEARIAEAEAGDARQDILRGLPRGHSAIVEGVDVTSDMLVEITRSERQSSKDVTLSRQYFIEQARSSQDGFQVRLRDAETNETVPATFGEALTSIEEQALVKQAFFEKRPIILTLEARARGELIISAQIKKAKFPPR